MVGASGLTRRHARQSAAAEYLCVFPSGHDNQVAITHACNGYGWLTDVWGQVDQKGTGTSSTALPRD